MDSIRLRRLCRLICLLLAGLGGYSVHADIVLIANAHCAFDQLSRDEAINIFMGRYRKLPDGSSAQPLDLEADSPVRRTFYRRLLDKSLEEVNTYWARLTFSGGTKPPAETKGQDEVLEKVANDRQAIGYLERTHLTRSERAHVVRNVKVILTLAD